MNRESPKMWIFVLAVIFFLGGGQGGDKNPRPSSNKAKSQRCLQGLSFYLFLWGCCCWLGLHAKQSYGGSWEKPVSCTWKSHIPHCYRRLFFSSLWPSHAGSWSNCCASGNHVRGWVVNRWQQINAYYCKIIQTKTKFTVIHWLCRCMFCMNYSAGILNRSQSRLELLCPLEARSIENQCGICYTFSWLCDGCFETWESSRYNLWTCQTPRRSKQLVPPTCLAQKWPAAARFAK